MSSGEGGLVTTNDDDLFEALWALHDGGRRRGDSAGSCALPGTNARLAEWQCAILRDIILPGMRPAFLRSFVYNFSSSMTTAGAIIFLIDFSENSGRLAGRGFFSVWGLLWLTALRP